MTRTEKLTRLVKQMDQTLKARRPAGIRLEPAATAKACRVGTKQAVLVDTLARKGGATMEELMEALSHFGKPWTAASVRSGLHWDVHHIKGYGVRTTFGRNKEQRYHLVLPAGLKSPIPHTE